MMKRILLALLMLTLSIPAHAWCDYEFSLRLAGWSKHTISSQRDEGEPWNETHNIYGVSCNRWSVMRFDNSWDKEAYSVTYETRGTQFTKNLKGSWLIGGWSGYEDVVGDFKVLPVVVPKLEYRIGPVGLESLLAGVVFTASIRIHF